MTSAPASGNDGPQFAETLVRLSQDLGFGVSRLERALLSITEVAAATLRVERCGVWRLDEDGDRLICLDLYHRGENRHDRDFAFEIREYLPYFEALDRSRVIDANDARQDPRTAAFTESYLEPFGITSMLDAPIRRRGEIIGVICNEGTDGPRAWTEQEAAFAASLGDLLGTAFEAAEHEELQQRFVQAQKLEAVGRLAGGVAHDFNNLLTALRGNLDLVRDVLRSHPAARAELRIELDSMQEATERAAALIRQLLTLGGRRIQGPESFDADEVVAGMRLMLRRLLPENIRLEFEFGDGGSPLHADPTQVEQIVLNLVLNARDAMPRGGRLRVASGPTKTATDEVWRLVVEDEGVGIESDKHQLVFEPFFTTKDEGKGSGLGLTTVLGIAKSLGGRVDLDSSSGRGCTFVVEVPLQRSSPA